jgi:TonB-linked SusC/RagA family outer membrane protein
MRIGTATITLPAKSQPISKVEITLELNNETLVQAFQKIEAQSPFHFMYRNKEVSGIRNLQLPVDKKSVEDFLKIILDKTSLTYRQVNNQILIMPVKNLMDITAFNSNEIPYIPDANEVNGKVTNADGEALSGVSVTIKGTQTGTSTNDKGNYSITAPVGSILVFSYVGFISKEVPVNGKETINVILESDTKGLGEVVVVAFGTQKKTDMVGSVTSVKPSELKVPSSNLTTALAGRIAGLISYQRSGEPGEDNASFFVRGVTSFGTGKVDPLILIDGVELSVTELARLRPDDIQSFSVMKDATATALYGARGANGVIYITTKEGKEGKATVSLRAEGSHSAPTSNIKFADPVSFMRLYNDALVSRDPFSEPLYSQEKIDRTAEGASPIIYPATDWRKTLFKNYTLNHRYNLNVSGGGKIARYYVAGSYSQDNGMLKVDKRNNFNNNVNLKSYTLRANVNVNLTKTTELIVRLNGNFDTYTGPIQGGGAMYNQVVRTNPVDFPAYYPVDSAHAFVQHIMFGGVKNRSFTNPYADMVKGYKSYDQSLMLTQLEFKQDLSFLTEGLSFRTMINTNRTSRYDIVRSYQPYYYQVSLFDKRTLEYQLENFNENTGTEFLDFSLEDSLRQQNSIFYMESALNYSRTFNKKHTLSGLLVSIFRSSSNARAGSLQLSLPSRNTGISGRTTYAYDNRYFAEFNFGYNGSERFYQDKRFGFFPSVGLAWSVSNEKFWEPLKDQVNNFRLRATYGLVGNDAIGLATDRFFYLSNVNMNSASQGFVFGREYGYYRDGINVTRYSNTDITWETSYKTNLAIELGLFNKVNIQADFYRETRKNILMNRVAIPTTMGLSADVAANIGEASGKGVDISIDYSQSFMNNWWLQVHGNFTYATNKYVTYEEPLYDKEWWKSRIGYPIQQQWGYIAERLFVDDSEVANSPLQNFGTPNIGGDIKYKDVNGDGQITELDQVPIGFPTIPEIVVGAGFSMGYKNFDLSVFFQGIARESFFIDPKAVQPFVGGNEILEVFANSHYSTANPDLYALWPRLSIQDQKNNTQTSTWWLNDGAFLRIKQAELGWSVPRKKAEKMYIKNLRAYVSGTNLFLFSHFKLWDIEMGGNGLGYPLQRVFNLGVNLTF